MYRKSYNSLSYKGFARFLAKFILQYPIAFCVILIAPASIILEINIIPYGFKVLIDTINAIEGSDFQQKPIILSQLFFPLCIILLSWCGMVSIMRFCYYVESIIIPKFQASIRIYVFEYVLGQKYGFFLDNFSGDLANKINNLPIACENIRQLIFWNIISSIIVTSFSFFMLFQVYYLFSFLMIIWIVIHLVIVLYFAESINHKSKQHANSQSILSGHIVDMISNIISLKTIERNQNNLSIISAIQDKEKQDNKSLMQRILKFQIICDLPVIVLLVMTSYLLVNCWLNDQVSAGDFVLVLNIMIGVMYNIVGLGHVLTDIFRESGRIGDSLSLLMTPYEEEDEDSLKELHITTGAIELSNVTFGYDECKPLFDKLSYNFAGGSKIGIMGDSGSGKSTLIKLLLRLFDSYKGKIEIDGQDISKIKLSSLYRHITYVPQDIILFHQNIMDNIKYGNCNISDQDVIAAAKRSNCHDFINSMPRGYNTIVGERGAKLSGGQRQRIALARAFLKNSKILIFDEATSALDDDTANFVQESIQLLGSQKTIIVISHQQSTLNMMDEIITIKNGKIINLSST